MVRLFLPGLGIRRSTSRPPKETEVIFLNAERRVLEVYGIMVGAVQGAVWVLQVFFMFPLIAAVIVKGMEERKTRRGC